MLADYEIESSRAVHYFVGRVMGALDVVSWNQKINGNRYKHFHDSVKEALEELKSTRNEIDKKNKVGQYFEDRP